MSSLTRAPQTSINADVVQIDASKGNGYILFDTIHPDNYDPGSPGAGKQIIFTRYNNVTAGIELCVRNEYEVSIINESH